MNVLAVLWAIAFGVCPQRPSHSLFFDGQQMPIEARMAGIFAGFLIGVGYIVARGRGRAWLLPDRRMTIVLSGFLALMGVDGVNAMFTDLGLPHLYSPNLPMRLGTGLLTGLAIAAILWPTFNATAWRNGKNLSPIASLRDLLGGVALLAVYFVAAFTSSGILLYPLSLLAVLGVPAVLLMTSTIVLTVLRRKDNQAVEPRDLFVPLLLGLIATVAILTVMGSTRYLLFGVGPLELPVIRPGG